MTKTVLHLMLLVLAAENTFRAIVFEVGVGGRFGSSAGNQDFCDHEGQGRGEAGDKGRWPPPSTASDTRGERGERNRQQALVLHAALRTRPRPMGRQSAKARGASRMLSFKPTFSLSSFTFIKRLFSSSLLSALRVASSAYLRLCIFLPKS